MKTRGYIVFAGLAYVAMHLYFKNRQLYITQSGVTPTATAGVRG